MKISLVLVLSFFSMLVAAQSTVNSVPHPKKSGWSNYVSNPDRILSADGVGTINDICAQIEEADSFQVAFVVLESIGQRVPKDFAGRLFNKWGIGHRGRDDGLLVLFVLDQKRIEFETGYGTETVLTDFRCVQIQEDNMVNFFWDEEYTEGLIEGAKAIQYELRGKKVDRFALRSLLLDDIRAEKERKRRNAERLDSFLLFIVLWHAIGLTLFLIDLLLARLWSNPYGKYKIIRIFAVWAWAIFPITHIFVILYARYLKERYRNMLRFSHKTYEVMRKLSEEDEDEYLSRGQISEELIRSVDYDVWITDNKDDLLILSYRPLFSKYTTCPKCHFRTYRKIHDRQIRPPSYAYDGMGERKHECSNCKYAETKIYYIRKLQSSGSSSGGSGLGSSGGGFSGGGGGGFGGGSSGGGGGGSSW
ncbi:MAG: TPM domain-containing protein [Crocinitomicaceae bacterium]|nr:TPM domain-containing protein [Crocinitomicaceae bacterium]